MSSTTYVFCGEIRKLEYAVDSTLSQIPMLHANVAKYHDGQRDGQMDLLSHNLAIRGSHVASLVKYCPVAWDEIA